MLGLQNRASYLPHQLASISQSSFPSWWWLNNLAPEHLDFFLRTEDHLLSRVVQLPDLLDPSIVPFFHVTGEGFHRYPWVLIFAIPVFFLRVERVTVDIVCLIMSSGWAQGPVTRGIWVFLLRKSLTEDYLEGGVWTNAWRWRCALWLFRRPFDAGHSHCTSSQ